MHVVANGQRKQDMSVVLSGNSSCLAYRVYFLSAEHVDSSWVNANAQRVWELSSKCNTTIATGGKRVSPLFMVSDSFEQICKQFEEHGYFVSISKTFGSGFHGATAVNVTVEPGKESSIPKRDFTGMLYINNYSSALCLKRTIRENRKFIQRRS